MLLTRIREISWSRVDLNKPDTMDDFNPMIGATYTLTDSTRLFGSVARKVRFPTLSQLYSTKSGNTDLTAEKSIELYPRGYPIHLDLLQIRRTCIFLLRYL